MEHSEIIRRYEDFFKEDPLYQYIQKNKSLYEELIQPSEIYNEVYFDTTCSTAQAAKILGIQGKQQTLLNFLGREDFQSYFSSIERKGERGYYRFDFKSLFQFKMILLLTGNELSPLDISALIGTSATYSYGTAERTTRRNETTPVGINTIDKDEVTNIVNNKFTDFMTLTANFVTQQIQKQQQISNVKLEEIQLINDLKHWESDMKHNGKQIELVERQIEALSVQPVLEQGFFSNLFNIRLNTKSQKNNEIINELENMKLKLVAERELIDQNKMRISKELEDKTKQLLKLQANNDIQDAANEWTESLLLGTEATEEEK